MKRLVALVLMALTSLAAHADSYLFGSSADQAFGNAFIHNSTRYRGQALGLLHAGYRPLSKDFGGAGPTPLRILIKDDSISSSLTQSYVDTLSTEKAYLMRIYGLSNAEYNKIAAIAFGILGRETKFGTSFKYIWKETHQTEIYEAKLAKKKFGDYVKALETGDPWKFFAAKTWQVNPNSRGLTQIKSIPNKIVYYYCINENQLNDPRVTAVATVGFLAESLGILKNRVRNRKLGYVTNENLFDYVLYVYFGSMRQLVNPVINYDTGLVVNETATPDRNLYIQTVHRYMRALAFYERPGYVALPRTNYACRIPGDR